jgi:hypothetical protein
MCQELKEFSKVTLDTSCMVIIVKRKLKLTCTIATKGSSPLGMKFWGSPPGKQPRSVEVLTLHEGNL